MIYTSSYSYFCCPKILYYLGLTSTHYLYVVAKDAESDDNRTTIKIIGGLIALFFFIIGIIAISMWRKKDRVENEPNTIKFDGKNIQNYLQYS